MSWKKIDENMPLNTELLLWSQYDEPMFGRPTIYNGTSKYYAADYAGNGCGCCSSPVRVSHYMTIDELLNLIGNPKEVE